MGLIIGQKNKKRKCALIRRYRDVHVEGRNVRKGADAFVAIYHLSAKILSRSAGRSAVAAAAYRSGGRLQDERTGRTYDFTRKRGVEHAEIVAPKRTPAWMLDRTSLWNGVEKSEKRRDAQLAREIEVALPRELAAERRVSVVREFVQDEFVSQGMIADIAVHVGRSRDGAEQPHAHILLTTRSLTAEGFGPKNRDWNATDRLELWRSHWAEHINRELERAGRDERIDHRSLEAQRAGAERQAALARAAGDRRAADAHQARADTFDREPEPKLGPIASQMEELGTSSRRGDERRDVKARNAERQRLLAQAREIARDIAATTRQLAADTRRYIQDFGRRIEAGYHDIYTRAEALIYPPPTRGAVEPRSVAHDATTAVCDVLTGIVGPTTTHQSSTADRDRLLGRAINFRDREVRGSGHDDRQR